MSKLKKFEDFKMTSDKVMLFLIVNLKLSSEIDLSDV